MRTFDEIMAQLQGVILRGGPSMVSSFESELAVLAEQHDEKCIEPLLGMLVDGAHSEEICFSIIHYLETFPIVAYLAALIRSTNALYAGAPVWARIVYMRVLNSDSSRSSLAKLVQGNEMATNAVQGVLGDIESRRPEFAQKVRSVLVSDGN